MLQLILIPFTEEAHPFIVDQLYDPQARSPGIVLHAVGGVYPGVERDLSKKSADAGTATGEHGREAFVRIFFSMYRAQFSGILNIQFQKRSRQLYFLGGEPISYRSDLPEDDLGRTLVNANLIPEKQLKWIRDKLSEGEDVEEAIVMSGALSAQQVREHKQSRMKSNIGSPLLWSSGQWTFKPRPKLNIKHIDPALRPQTNGLNAIWHAVEQHVGMDAVFPKVTDAKAGLVALDPLCPALFPALGVDEEFASLPEVVGDGCSVEEIFRRIPDGTGNLVKLLWFLETAGLAHREGRPKDETIEGQLSSAFHTPQPEIVAPSAGKNNESPPTKAKPVAEGQKESGRGDGAPREKRRREALTDDQLRAAHRKRMGRDFYAFIGLPLGSPPAAIDRKCKGLARRWRTPGKERQLPADVQAKVDELLAGVQLVWRTLTDDTHRQEYNKRVQQGRAPKVGDFQTASTAPAPSSSSNAPQPDDGLTAGHKKARALMAKNDFKAALPLLKKIRIDDPSSPAIMADLGWSTWNLHGDKNGDAQEFLRLALTFDPNHPEGLEYLSKILVEQNETETAQKLLMRLVRVAPDPTWAKKALQNLTKGGGK